MHILRLQQRMDFFHLWVYFPIADQVIFPRKKLRILHLCFVGDKKNIEHRKFEPIFMFKILNIENLNLFSCLKYT